MKSFWLNADIINEISNKGIEASSFTIMGIISTLFVAGITRLVWEGKFYIELFCTNLIKGGYFIIAGWSGRMVY
jgi:hypothetical protein